MRHFAIFLLLIGSLFGAEILENGATSVITYFVMRDVTTGLRDTGVTIANLEMYYIEDQAAESADVFGQAHGAVTDAWTDGECIHVGHGVYRVDWPNAAFDGGIGKRVQLTLVDGDAGAGTETIVMLLSPPSNVITVAGTSQTGNDNGADINAILVDTGTTLDDLIDTEIATIVTAVGNIETDTAAYDTDAEYATAIWNAATNAYGGAGTYGQALEDVLADTSAFDTAAEWLALLAAVNTDATSATHATTYVTLEAGTASDDAYNGQTISVTDATDGHAETRRIEDYTSGRQVTFDRALSFTPVQDDIIRIYDMPYNAIAAVAGGTANTYIVTDTGAAGGTPIPDVAVWLTIDSAGARLVTSGVTDDNGEIVFYLDSGITYYVWMTKSGYSFSDNGEAWVAD